MSQSKFTAHLVFPDAPPARRYLPLSHSATIAQRLMNAPSQRGSDANRIYWGYRALAYGAYEAERAGQIYNSKPFAK